MEGSVSDIYGKLFYEGVKIKLMKDNKILIKVVNNFFNMISFIKLYSFHEEELEINQGFHTMLKIFLNGGLRVVLCKVLTYIESLIQISIIKNQL